MSEIRLVDLDSIEIVTAVERAFRIEISDDEAVSCRSVGDLYLLVLGKVPVADRGACHTALCFRELRAALRKQIGRREITPATQLTDLMPVWWRRAWWRRFKRSTNLVLPSPPLYAARRRGWHWLIFGVAFSVALAFGAGGWAILVGVTTVLLLALIESEAKIYGMGAGATVGDLAKMTASLNAGQLAVRHGSIRKAEVWDALVSVIRNFTGYPGPLDQRTQFRCI